MILRRAAALSLAALLSHAPAAGAQEWIRAYDVYIDVRRDGSIDITERISVRAEGDEIRRGIYRDFPTRYRDRLGNNVRVGMKVLGVERNDAREAWFTERLSNGIRINTGGDDYLPQLPGDYTFTIRYRTTRQLGFFDDHDELYWNAIGTGWIFPIQSGTVTVRLPEGVPVDRMHAEAYTGPQGAKGSDYIARIPVDGLAVYQLTAPLRPQEGFTIVLTFPKGIIAEPTTAERLRWFLGDNAGVLVALAGFIVLLYFTSTRWWRHGRDPRPGIIIPRYVPPEGHSPSALRYMKRMRYDSRCFSAELISLAVAGYVTMRQNGKRRSSGWTLERVEPPASPIVLATEMPAAAGTPPLAGALPPFAGGSVLRSAPPPAAARSVSTAAASRITDAQRALLERLFPRGRGKLEIGKAYDPDIGEAVRLHTAAVEKTIQPRYLLRHGRSVAAAFGILVATAVAAFIVGGGAGIPAILFVLAVMLFTTIVFIALVRAPTEEGRLLLDQIEGLILYMSVAEREVIKRMQAPSDLPRVDPARYEALLPYAIALDVEDAWTKKFTEAVGAAAAAQATQRMTWYSGSGRPGDLGGFTKSLGSSFSSSISSSSTPPGSSSGSGGGGSSGGGGGGGGGGGR